ncbi:putative Predicted aminopeptidases [Carnobacterium maltaromaticum]|uniref:M28 family peptidase n=1 Tax=Carnobacterium maltaromaticum TaxID=2751 RepID=UPI00191B9713|nr:M28 family peptidase [Carnobacterium maltaromaticum]CAD5901771.1 putative Predicted aminopeptidases [Carnobacterium maltaromaticum]
MLIVILFSNTEFWIHTNFKSDTVPVNRITEHVKIFAKDPRPNGSEQIDKVKNYIVKQTTDAGLKADVQNYQGNITYDGFEGNVNLNNIMVSIEGSGINHKRQNIYFMAHYDSVPTGPGANDNGVNVAILLELIKYAQSKKFENNIHMIFTDGEEKGLLGSYIFWNNLENIENSDLVINLEARGVSGASVLFQTSENNFELIKSLANTKQLINTNSFLTDIYSLLPNDTDLSVPLEKKLAGLNYTYFNGYDYYHTEKDNSDNLKPETIVSQYLNIQHSLDIFGNNNLSLSSNKNAIYFSSFGQLIVLDEISIFVISIVSIIVGILFLITLSGKNLIVMIQKNLIIIFLVVMGILLSYMISFLLWKFVAEKMTIFNGATYDQYAYTSIFICTSILFYLFLNIKYRLVIDYDDMLLVNSELLILSLIFLKGASYLFLIGLITSLLCSMINLTMKHLHLKHYLVLITNIISLMLYVPIIYLCWNGLTYEMMFIIVIPTILLLIGLSPMINLLSIQQKIKIQWVVIFFIIFLTGVLVFNSCNGNYELYENIQSVFE